MEILSKGIIQCLFVRKIYKVYLRKGYTPLVGVHTRVNSVQKGVRANLNSLVPYQKLWSATRLPYTLNANPSLASQVNSTPTLKTTLYINNFLGISSRSYNRSSSRNVSQANHDEARGVYFKELNISLTCVTRDFSRNGIISTVMLSYSWLRWFNNDRKTHHWFTLN